MTDYSDYFYLGKITKKHGFDGRVYIYLDTDEPDHYIDLKMVYIDMGGTLVPYFIEELSIKGNKALVMISDVDSEDADNLINKELYLPIDQLPELKGNKFYYHEAKGMVVKDNNY